MQLREFVWTLRSSVRVVFNPVLLIDAKDKSKSIVAITIEFDST